MFPSLTCPVTGNTSYVHNLTYPLSYARYVPEGYYRYQILLKDDIDDYIFAVNLTARIRNSHDMQAFK